ncbi:MAG: hypothetical protein MUC85_04345 [Anaerolineales bacterium]|nr:hypothetical protein [Anaerolineales bacterium]
MPRSRFWLYLTSILLLIFWLIAFSEEVKIVLRWLLGHYPVNEIDTTEGQRAAWIIAMLVVFGTALYALLWRVITARFVLPTRGVGNLWRMFWRLGLYYWNFHGVAAEVNEGRLITNPFELNTGYPGVIKVDLTSAMVLERQPFLRDPDPDMNRLIALTRVPMDILLWQLFRPRGGPDARAAGQSVVLTQVSERLRGVVSLRRQVRFRLQTPAVTRDGFQVQGNVIVIFTLGENPETILVTYDGEASAENLRAVILDDKMDDRPGGNPNRRIRFVDELRADELDEADRTFIVRGMGRVYQRFEENPYIFDPERVFAAVYGRMRLVNPDPNEAQEEVWSDLPVQVAVDIFHNMALLMTYDELHRPDDPVVFPYPNWRQNYMRTVRNQGVLNYQMVQRKDGNPITVGMAWDANELEIGPVRRLENSKVLRDRGIKVLVATIPELTPVNQQVLVRRFDTYQARLQGEASRARAPFDREVILTYAQERAQAQKDILEKLSPLIRDNPASSEVIAHALLQTLEAYASDRNTRQLLSQETIETIWLLDSMLRGGIP